MTVIGDIDGILSGAATIAGSVAAVLGHRNRRTLRHVQNSAEGTLTQLTPSDGGDDDTLADTIESTQAAVVAHARDGHGADRNRWVTDRPGDRRSPHHHPNEENP